ncbi:MAG: hypothetical protein ACLFPE_08245 [Bacteroidales bacterium]
MKKFQALIFICEDIAKILNLANADVLLEKFLAFPFILLMMKRTGGVFNRPTGMKTGASGAGFI